MDETDLFDDFEQGTSGLIDEMLLIAMRAWYGCDGCDVPCAGIDMEHWLCPLVVFGIGKPHE